MKTMVINHDRLKQEEMEERVYKARCILLNKKKECYIQNYGGVYLFPGGAIQEGETSRDAVIREVEEELGIRLSNEDLELLGTCELYAKEFPNRKDTATSKRYMKSDYYVCCADFTVNLEKQKLTAREKSTRFEIYHIPIEEIETLLQEEMTTKKRIFFDEEIRLVMQLLKENYCGRD